MSFAAVTIKDFSDARRSRSLWLLSVLFVGFTLLMTYVYTLVPELTGDEAVELSTLGLLEFIAAPATLFITIAALVVCYKAIAGESESGSGKLLLSLPHSRANVVLGKIVGRWLVLVVPLAIGLVAALGMVLALGIPFSEGVYAVAGLELPAWPVEYGLFVALTMLYALVYVSLIVGISASTTSTSKAAAMALGIWVFFELVWDVVPVAAVFVVNGFRFPADMTTTPDWVAFLEVLSPSAAYLNAAGSIIAEAGTGAPEAVPFYLSGWFAIVLLGVWIVVPAAIGYLRYRNADL